LTSKSDQEGAYISTNR